MQIPENKADLVERYYEAVYSDAQKLGVQGFGGRLADRSLLNELKKHRSGKILELGAGSGEFTQKAMESLVYSSYVATDLQPERANPALARRLKSKTGGQNGAFEFIRADAQALPFEDSSFDLVFSTCLLAHVDSPSDVIHESLRVLKADGALVFLMPTDPGLLNQFIKWVLTYPKLRKLGVLNPQYVYALEHKNPIHNLIAASKYFSAGHRLRTKYRPFLVPSWNLNFWLLCVIKKGMKQP
jgi:ubiquinone/menaquinone biosynthesis C-methylase UbiE